MKEHYRNFTFRAVPYLDKRLEKAVEDKEIEKKGRIKPDSELYTGKNFSLVIKMGKYGNKTVDLLMRAINTPEASRLSKLLEMNVN